MALTYTISAIDNFSGVFDKVSSTVEAVGKKMTDVGKQMSLKVTAPIVGVGTAAFAAADSMDKAYNNIAISSGAVGGDLENLKGTFMEVFKEIPDSADVASSALANLNTLTGAVDDDLRNLTKSVLDASRTLGEDAVANSVAFGKAMKQWQIPTEEGTRELDKLYKLTQDYGVGLGEISSQLTAYGSVLNNAGFTMDETAHFFASLASEGLAVTRIMPALNAAFRNWAAEGKNSRSELQKVIDVIKNTEDSQKALALATEVFGAQGAQRLTTAIRNGTIPALDELGDMFEGTAGLIDSTTNATKTVGDRLAELKNQAQIGLEPLGAILVEIAQEFLPPLIEHVSNFAEWMSNLDPKALKVAVAIGGVLAVIGPFLTILGMLLPAINAVGAALTFLAANPVGLIITAIGALVAGLIYLFNTNETFREVVVAVWEWIKTAAMTIFGAIQAFWDEWGSTILSFFQRIWDAVKMVFDVVFGAIQTAVTFVFNEIKAFWDKWGDTIIEAFRNYFEIVKIVWTTVFNVIKTVVETVFNWIKAFWDKWGSLIISQFEVAFGVVKTIFENTWNVIKTVIETVIGVISGIIKLFLSVLKGDWEGAWDAIKGIVESIWDGIVGVIKGAANVIIGIANGVIGAFENMLNFVGDAINKIPEFTVPDWVPLIGGKTFSLPKVPTISLPKIPALDIGTDRVLSDGLAMLHAGEAVVPAAEVAGGGFSGGGRGGGDIIVNITNPRIFSDREVDEIGRAIVARIRTKAGVRF